MAVMVANLRATGRRRDVQVALGKLAETLGEKAIVWVPKYEHPEGAHTPSWVTKPQFEDVELSFDVEVDDAEEPDEARSLVIEALRQADPEGATLAHEESDAAPDVAPRVAADSREWALLGSNQ
jgi:hypothetical protein